MFDITVIFVTVCNIDLPAQEARSETAQANVELWAAEVDDMEVGSKRIAGSGSQAWMKYGMWACCAAMMVPVLAYLAYLAFAGASGTAGNLVAFAPLVLCVGAHLVMHRHMGKSCHGKAQNADDTNGARDVRAFAGIAAE